MKIASIAMNMTACAYLPTTACRRIYVQKSEHTKWASAHTITPRAYVTVFIARKYSICKNRTRREIRRVTQGSVYVYRIWTGRRWEPFLYPVYNFIFASLLPLSSSEGASHANETLRRCTCAGVVLKNKMENVKMSGKSVQHRIFRSSPVSQFVIRCIDSKR